MWQEFKLVIADISKFGRNLISISIRYEKLPRLFALRIYQKRCDRINSN